MCSLEMSVPRGSHAGKKEIDQKSWAAPWHVGSFVQDALLSLTTRRYGQGGYGCRTWLMGSCGFEVKRPPLVVVVVVVVGDAESACA